MAFDSGGLPRLVRLALRLGDGRNSPSAIAAEDDFACGSGGDLKSEGMRTAGALLLFATVFLASGVAMHYSLYDSSGVFVWSLREDPETGKSGFARTVLALAQPTEFAAASGDSPASAKEKEEEKSAESASAEGKAADAVAEKQDADEGGEIALFDGKTLGTWKKTAFGGEGDVFVNDEGHLEFGFGAVITGVNWNADPPASSNYEISLEAMKLDGNDFFLALTFPVKESHATFVVGGWGGGIVGISCVDDLNASENETMSIDGFAKDVWHKVTVRVSDDRLQAWIDDTEKVDLDLTDRKISLLPGDIELSAPIGIAAYQTRAQYRNIVWRSLPAAE